jgi:deoxyhypusine synthase
MEFKEREYKNRINEIQTLIGIDIDFDKIFSKTGTKELNQFKLQKEAVGKLDNVLRLNNELEHKNTKLMKQIEEMKKEDVLK